MASLADYDGGGSIFLSHWNYKIFLLWCKYILLATLTTIVLRKGQFQQSTFEFPGSMNCNRNLNIARLTPFAKCPKKSWHMQRRHKMFTGKTKHGLCSGSRLETRAILIPQGRWVCVRRQLPQLGSLTGNDRTAWPANTHQEVSEAFNAAFNVHEGKKGSFLTRSEWKALYSHFTWTSATCNSKYNLF